MSKRREAPAPDPSLADPVEVQDHKMTAGRSLEPSDPVHPLVAKADRLSSEWFYEFCAKYGVDYPDEATPEQQEEYEAELDIIHSRIREEYAAEKARQGVWSY
ncbi:hypothetical protein AB8O64_23415 [Streptomyces sp. QH1-20]|uniref:hypothetical protein n=1 Tax=Streptomyces sp. QH1-20 TaxID=3240934 RepID=UPI003510DA3E